MMSSTNTQVDMGLRGLDLAVECLAHIEYEPIRHDQKHWGWATLVLDESENGPFTPEQLDELRGGKYASWDMGGTVSKMIGDVLPPSCGTAFCVAGWAAQLTGQGMQWRLQDLGVDESGRVKLEWQGQYTLESKGVGTVAASALGIPRYIELDGGDDPLTDIFDSINSLDTIYEAIAVAYKIGEDTLRARVQTRLAEFPPLPEGGSES